jgi:iron complex outermembrane receptor protein
MTLHCARSLRCSISLSVLAIAASTISLPAMAQETASDDEVVQESEASQKQATDDIVVTGTLIRGIAPTGSSVIGLTKQSIQASGATTTNEVLATIPQAGNFFMTVPQIGAGNGGNLQVLRPNLRDLPSSNTASGAATLLLVDGHRTVDIGVDQTAPDPQTVPAALLERVEVITDGASSIYGSDAIGGVINYITRRRFDGVEVSARYGFADDYYSFDASATVGKAWDTGSIFIGYTHSQNDAIFGRDRDYHKAINWNTGLPVGNTCPSPNIEIGANRYVVSGNGLAQVAVQPTCDLTDNAAIVPSQKQNSVMAGLSQELSPSMRVDIRAYYTNRSSTAVSNPFTASPTIRSAANPANTTNANPFYRPATPGDTTNQVVRFSYGPALGLEASRTTNVYEHYGITPEFTIDLSEKWRARLMFNYGRSLTTFTTTALNSTTNTADPNYVNSVAYALNGNTATRPNSDFLNPYDIASSNPAVLARISNWQTAGESKQELFNYRGVVDGSLFTLPGGEVKIAGGIEYMVTKLAFRKNTAGQVPGPLTLPYNRANRNIFSLFGEVSIPVVGEDNASPMFHSLTLSASGRYDRYSDYGSTFNPRVGISYMPVAGIRLRGNWAKSFNAPTLLDQVVGTTASIGATAGSFITGTYNVDPRTNPSNPPNANSIAITLGGALPGLVPQKATTWSIGGDIEPPFIPGLRLSASYYKIDFKGALGKPGLFDSNVLNILNNFPMAQIYDRTDGIVNADIVAGYLAQATNPNVLSDYLASTNPLAQVYTIQDFRTMNLRNSTIAGIDFSVNYVRETGFGSVDLAVNGNVKLQNDTQVSAAGTFFDDLLTNRSLFSLSATAGANVGDFRGQVTFNRVNGFDIVPSATLLQDRVGSFSVVNLFFSYDLKKKFMAESIQLTLNINNLFDTDPPIYRTTNGGGGTNGGAGYANGQTLGRYIQLGARAKF